MKAMILAAGLGTRMKPLTDNCPKPLLKVAGMPLIEHHIKKLVQAGIKDIVINHAYLGDMIEEYLADGSQLGCNISYSRENEPLETAGGIIKALPLLKQNNNDGYFLLVNGDVWLDETFAEIENQIQQLKVQNKLGHLWLVNNPEHHPTGDFLLTEKSDVLTKEQSEANSELDSQALTFAGVSILSLNLFNQPELIEQVAVSTPIKLAPILKQAMEQNAITGQHFTGHWVDVGTPQRLAELEEYINNHKP